MKFYLVKMLEIYKPDKVDWMNFDVTKNNPYSYHHIVKRSDGGKSRPDNGAILTRLSHKFLHFLEIFCPDAFYDYQRLFRRINDTNAPSTDELAEEIDEIMQNVFNGSYEFTKNIDLDDLYNTYLTYYRDDITVKKLVK